jgi:hypothetical protein
MWMQEGGVESIFETTGREGVIGLELKKEVISEVRREY